MSPGIPYDDLPAALKRKVQERDERGGPDASPGTPLHRSAVAAASAPSSRRSRSLYRCHKCGFEAPYGTPMERHVDTHGGGRIELVLDTPCVECDGTGLVRDVTAFEGAAVAELGPARPCSTCEREP